jgi:transposase InsO family protein
MLAIGLRINPYEYRCEGLVERNFTAPAPNRIWTADITYVGTDEGFL